ncbi:MAG: hypothetical protein RMY28_022540 [Nostoc sp. ChiSLP01]|nr:hypothetical protein [Nostoc sp. CmiSLP01]MDZ8288829.1 hypothetical protein [Nostoc sp. ChiSLP01]
MMKFKLFGQKLIWILIGLLSAFTTTATINYLTRLEVEFFTTAYRAATFV